MFPVLAHATRLRPSRRASEKAADFAGDRVVLLEQRTPLPDGNDVLGLDEGQQLAEAPDAREIEPALGLEPLGRPAVLEEPQRVGHLEPIPVVFHVQKGVALGASEQDLVDVEGLAAIRVDANLMRFVAHGRSQDREVAG